MCSYTGGSFPYDPLITLIYAKEGVCISGSVALTFAVKAGLFATLSAAKHDMGVATHTHQVKR